MYTVSDFRFPVYRLLSFCQRKSKSSKSKNTRRETKTNEKSKEKFALVSSLAVTAATALLLRCLRLSLRLRLRLCLIFCLVVILNFDAGTFCALPWLLLKIYTRAYLGTCFAILLPVPSPPSLLAMACSTCLDSSFASQHVASCSCCHCCCCCFVCC